MIPSSSNQSRSFFEESGGRQNEKMLRVGGNKKINCVATGDNKMKSVIFSLVGPLNLLSAEKRTKESIVPGLMEGGRGNRGQNFGVRYQSIAFEEGWAKQQFVITEGGKFSGSDFGTSTGLVWT